MPTEIIDLDELVRPPKRVKIAGETYTLPGELPVPLYLRLRAEEQAYAEAEDADTADGDQRITDLNDLLLDLFRVHQPDLEELPLGLLQLFTLIPAVYGASSIVDESDEGEGEGDPNPPARPRARTGSKSTRTRRKPASRS